MAQLVKASDCYVAIEQSEDREFESLWGSIRTLFVQYFGPEALQGVPWLRGNWLSGVGKSETPEGFVVDVDVATYRGALVVLVMFSAAIEGTKISSSAVGAGNALKRSNVIRVKRPSMINEAKWPGSTVGNSVDLPRM